jgi:hypothetical protein
LIHTCTLQKRTEGAGSAAGYGHGTTTWAAATTGVACRLDAQPARGGYGGEEVNRQNEGAPVLYYTLFLAWRSELATYGASAEYRVTTVKRADGTTIDAGPFDIQHVTDAGGSLGRLLELSLLRAAVTA